MKELPIVEYFSTIRQLQVKAESIYTENTIEQAVNELNKIFKEQVEPLNTGITLADLIDQLASQKLIRADTWMQIAAEEAKQRGDEESAYRRGPEIYGSQLKFATALKEDFEHTVDKNARSLTNTLNPQETKIVKFSDYKKDIKQ